MLPQELVGWQPNEQENTVFTNFRFLELSAMEAFGKMPDEWDMLPKTSRAEAMAYVQVSNKIEAYHMKDVGKDKK